MKTRFDNSQLAHVYAQQNQDYGQNANRSFWFQGRSLYSYSTEIARFIEGRLVKTTIRYSTTTPSKHQNQLYGIAVGEQYSVNCSMGNVSDNWTKTKQLIFETMLAGIKAEIERLSRARSYTSLDCLHSVAASAESFYEKYKPLQFRVKDFGINKEALQTLANQNDETTAELLTKFKIDIKKKQAKYKEAQAKKRAEDQKKLETKITEWRNGEIAAFFEFRNIPPMLRISKDETNIETSHGASVPSYQAKELYQAMKKGLDLSNHKIGQFTVVGLKSDIIKIGCHEIPLSEVEAIAEEFGWSKKPKLKLVS